MESLSTSEKQCLQKIREFLEREEKITIRLLQSALSYASPRSVSVLLSALMEKWWIYRDAYDMLRLVPVLGDAVVSLRRIPLIGNIACGTPLFVEENIEVEIPISSTIVRESRQYFFLRACGDSMNQKGIHHGDYVLIESKNTAENGDIIVALINEEATLKEFQRQEDTIFLIPHSDNPLHTPIILDRTDETFLIQWVLVRIFPGDFFTHF